MIVFASCDSKYLLEHGRAFIVSAYKVGFWAYINIINPTKEAFKLLDSLPCTYSIEYTINPTKTYYACSRFHSFPVVEELLICDIDCFFNKPFDPPKEDVGLFLRENENEMMKVATGIVWYRDTDKGIEFSNEASINISKEPQEWFADQRGMYKTYLQFKDKIDFFRFDNKYMDWEFTKDSYMWTGKGPRKYRNKLYLEKKREYENCSI